MVDAQQVTVPPRRSVTFKVRVQASDCAPSAFMSVVLEARAYLMMNDAQTCFLYTGASNVTLKATKGAEECPPDAIPGSLGAEEMPPGMATATTLLLAPQYTYMQPNTPAQDAVRVQQRAAKASWALSSDVGKDVGVQDVVLQEEASVSSRDAQATIISDPAVTFSVCM